MTALERLIEHGLAGTMDAVRRVRARVQSLAKRHRGLPSTILLRRIRDEITRDEPDIAESIQGGLLAAWVSAASKPAKEVPRQEEPPEEVEFGPSRPILSPLEPEGQETRWPALEAGANDLLARQVVMPDVFATLATDAKNAAFTVARVMRDDTIEAVRDAVARDVLEGGTLRQFRQTVGDALDAAGLSEPQVEALYRTHTGLARASGVLAVLDHPLVAPEFPYTAWHATRDSRVRPDHLAMETAGIQGTNVYRSDDPLFRRVWAPAGWNCRCHVQLLSLEDAAAAGIHEARQWLRTGEPPASPAFVDSVPIVLPADWPVPDGRIRAAV